MGSIILIKFSTQQKIINPILYFVRAIKMRCNIDETIR